MSSVYLYMVGAYLSSLTYQLPVLACTLYYGYKGKIEKAKFETAPKIRKQNLLS